VYLGSHGVGLLTWGVGWCEVWHGHLFLMPVWCGVGRAVLWVLVRPSSRAYTTARRCAVSMADHRPSWLDVGTRIEVQWDIVTDEDEQSFVECVCPSLTSPNRIVVDALGQHTTRTWPLSHLAQSKCRRWPFQCRLRLWHKPQPCVLPAAQYHPRGPLWPQHH
jgi:hypothetical protein